MYSGISVSYTHLDVYKRQNDYYGIHLAFEISLTVYSLLVMSYGSWLCAARDKCYEAHNHMLVIKIIVDLATLTLIAVISESTSGKVFSIIVCYIVSYLF